MIPNHSRFIEAIAEKKKVSVRFFSLADNGVLDRICAPMDYGPGSDVKDARNRYLFWDYKGTPEGSHTLSLLPQQVLDLQVLGEVFDPAHFGAQTAPWFIPRNWV